MILTDEQLIIRFERTDSSPDAAVLLHVCHSARDYFAGSAGSRVSYKVPLPGPFFQSAFGDELGKWRQRPRPIDRALMLGEGMWHNLPVPLQQEMLSGSPAHPKKIAIISTATGLDDIPWEWIRPPGRGPLAFDESVRLVRLVPALYAAPPLTVTPPVRVLVVVTNPKDERLLNPYVELDVICPSLRNTNRYSLHVLEEPTVDALRRELESAPHIVHYVGHSGVSSSRGSIILHDHSGTTRWISGAEISQLIPASVRLLCLSTCITAENYQTAGLSKLANASADFCLPTTIVNQYALHRPAAERFWREFYLLLLQHNGNVAEAFHAARCLAHTADERTLDAGSFSLVIRDGAGQPFEFSQEQVPTPLNAAELEAEWAARLANNIAVRMHTMPDQVRQQWEKSIEGEERRLSRYEQEVRQTRSGMKR